MTQYKLTEETIEVSGKTLYRIELTEDCKWGTEGTKGGYIESTSNLSDNAWVSDNVMVYDNALISGDAWVTGNAMVYGNASVSDDSWVMGNTKVYGDVVVSDNVKISGNAMVYGNAMVSGNSWVSGNAIVCGDAVVCGEARVSGNAKVCGDAIVYGDIVLYDDDVIEKTSDYMTISSLGDENRTITITFSNKMITSGCFRGTLSEFKNAVDIKYNGKGNYYPTIKYIESLFNESL